MLIDYLENEQTTLNTKRVVSIIQGNDSDTVTLNDGDILDVLPLRNRVLFPGVMMPVAVGRPKSLKLVTNAYNKEQLVAVCCQKEKDTQEPKANDLY
ncbi:MAG: LON peptidase substrate-binding domain-containing protein, partial [Paludibacteraceae bacterium]